MTVYGIYSEEYFTKARLPVVRTFFRAIQMKSNPRSESYMTALFLEKYPKGVFCNIDKPSSVFKDVTPLDKVVLLYPDATGLGYGRIEKKFKSKDVWVLNGRKRQFQRTRKSWVKFKFLRFLEKTMIPEFIFMASFVVVTPLLLLVDLLRGKR